MTLEERGIILRPWQKDMLDSFCKRTAIPRETVALCRERSIGKTFLSYVMNMLEAEGKDEYTANPVYDLDCTTHVRRMYWYSGFIEFINEYYQEYSWAYDSKTLIVSKPKSKISKLLDLLRKGRL